MEQDNSWVNFDKLKQKENFCSRIQHQMQPKFFWSQKTFFSQKFLEAQ